jgi:hypothetical protein
VALFEQRQQTLSDCLFLTDSAPVTRSGSSVVQNRTSAAVARCSSGLFWDVHQLPKRMRISHSRRCGLLAPRNLPWRCQNRLRERMLGGPGMSMEQCALPIRSQPTDIDSLRTAEDWIERAQSPWQRGAAKLGQEPAGCADGTLDRRRRGPNRTVCLRGQVACARSRSAPPEFLPRCLGQGLPRSSLTGTNQRSRGVSRTRMHL